MQELAFGRKAATVPVADGEPGHELQVDTGWVLSLEPDATGVRRRKKAFVFTPNVSRYRFVYPIERETTLEAIAACEAAWAFYGGVFRVMVIDNMKAVVARADRLEPKIIEGFREYAQARGFFVVATRVRRPKDKPRVERSVRDVRDDCFAGERLQDLDAARARALRWCRDEYGISPACASAKPLAAGHQVAELLHPPPRVDHLAASGRATLACPPDGRNAPIAARPEASAPAGSGSVHRLDPRRSQHQASRLCEHARVDLHCSAVPGRARGVPAMAICSLAHDANGDENDVRHPSASDGGYHR